MLGSRKKLVMCQACRGLIDPGARQCPLCGRESVPPLLARAREQLGTAHFISRLVLTINIVLFVLMALADMRADPDGASFINGASSAVLADFGSRVLPLLEAGQWWRLVTPIFLHLGLMHLLFNSIALYQIGPQVEEIYGSQKFIFIYLATGVAGNVGSWAFGIQGAGASGAIFGLIGLMAVYGYRRGGTFGRALMRQMLIWAAVGALFGLVIGADNVNHAGGFMAGSALGFLLTGEEPGTRRGEVVWNAAAVLAALLIVASFVMVAVNYGTFQHTRPEMVRVHQRVSGMEGALLASFQDDLSDPETRRQSAAALRSAARDLAALPTIDAEGDRVRNRLINLADRRAALLERDGLTAEQLEEATAADNQERRDAIQEFNRWFAAAETKMMGG